MRGLALLTCLAGCVIGQRSLQMPDNSETTVALFTGGLGPPMNHIARHPWFAVRKAGETQWRHYEVGGSGGADSPLNDMYVDPILHGLWRGAEGDRAAACIEREGPPTKAQIERDYFYPGPNSNTFGDVILRKCGLRASLPATSAGKDWRGLAGASFTSEGTGFQIDTALAGFKLGLKEGVELHLLGLSFGVDFWPPALIVPLGPGRLGFADR